MLNGNQDPAAFDRALLAHLKRGESVTVYADRGLFDRMQAFATANRLDPSLVLMGDGQGTSKVGVALPTLS